MPKAKDKAKDKAKALLAPRRRVPKSLRPLVIPIWEREKALCAEFC